MLEDFQPRRPKRTLAAKGTPPPSVDEDTIPEPEFQPPQVVAEKDAENTSETPDSTPKPTEKIKLAWKNFHPFKRLNLNRKQSIILGAAMGLLLAIVVVWWFAFREKPAPPPPPVVKQEVKKVEPPKPTTEPARLSGLTVPIELNKMPVTAVMIENSPDARPQAGLREAGVVFEAIAEGGITRFVALFQTEQPESIGPVRSVRPYYLDLINVFDAGVAHAGGSAEGLARVRQMKDLDNHAAFFHRVNTRYAPHNLYTSRAKLLEYQNSKGWPTSTFTSFPRKAEKAVTPPTARAFDFAISGYLYNPHFDYDVATNSYLRSMAGKPHTDEKTGIHINPKTVVAVVMPHRYAGIYSVYQTTGTGKAFIFQDGGVTEGTWDKPDINTQLSFKNASGVPVLLNPGQTWITLVSTPGAVTFTP